MLPIKTDKGESWIINEKGYIKNNISFFIIKLVKSKKYFIYSHFFGKNQRFLR